MTMIGGAARVILGVAALGSLLQARLEPLRQPRDAAGWVAAYNARDFGQPGLQRVSIELKSGAQVTRRFTVVNAWRVKGDGVDSVYLLEAPRAMAGTAYLQSEVAGEVPDLHVRLFLPSGHRRVLTLAPEEHGEGLLGSDFTYEDLGKRLPLDRHTYRLQGPAEVGAESAVVLEVDRPSGAWRRARLWIATGQPYLLAAQYFRDARADRPYKRFRVNRFRSIQGVRSAEEMTMTADDGRATVITLIDAKFRVPALTAEVFAPEQLPRLGERLSGLLAR